MILHEILRLVTIRVVKYFLYLIIINKQQNCNEKEMMSSNKNPNKKGKNGGGGTPGRQMILWLGVFLAVAFLISSFSDIGKLTGKTEDITYDEFLKQVTGSSAKPKIKSIIIQTKSGEISGEYVTTGLPSGSFQGFKVQGPPAETMNLDFNKMLEDSGIQVIYQAPSAFTEAILYLLPIILFGLLFYMLIARQMKGSGGSPFSFGKSKAVRVEPNGKHKKTFKDVAGVDEAREEVKEVVDFLRSPQKAERLGGRLPRGVLLIGPPGTGKTLLAKAIAGEADVPFFSISGSDFVEMFVGVGASRVRDLFEQAKANSPCIIFLDEVDAVGRKRANDQPGSGQEAAQTLNAILVEMDGFTSDDKVIVMAATNRVDVLDPALLRPGRFDRRIHVDLPDIKGREEILKVHVKNVKLGDDVDLSVVARATPTFSGAELENIVNEAALLAAFTDLDKVNMACFEEARDKVRFGKEKKTRVMHDDDRRDTAYHEAGHALLMHKLPHVTPLHKVSIIPRGRALGVTMQLPERDEYSSSKKKLIGEIVIRVGGRAAEELFLDDISNGASNDIEQATTYAKAMICEWGMSEKLGMVNYSDRHLSQNTFGEGREYSETTAELIDTEVRTLISNCYQKALDELKNSKDEVDLIVQALMEFEVLGREEFEKLLSERSLDNIRTEREASKKRDRYIPDSEESKDDDGALPPPLPDEDQDKKETAEAAMLKEATDDAQPSTQEALEETAEQDRSSEEPKK